MRPDLLTVSSLTLALAIGGCSSRSLDDYESGTGGSSQGGTSSTGGVGGIAGGGGTSNTGDTSTGGTSTGGTGGTSNTGGTGTGGTTGGTGGTNTGGTNTGGTNTGGTNTGGTGGTTGGTGGTTGGTGGTTGGTGGTGTTPVCGNSQLETGEQCDDGNKTGGDGCDANCQVVCTDVTGSAVAHTSGGRVHCYWAIVGSNSWTDSQDKCQNAYGKKGHLVSITSSSENSFVASTYAASSSIWIGGTDGQATSSTTQGTYAWVNGEAISTYKNYDTSEPNWASCGAGCVEHRLIMNSGGKWADVGAAESYVGVCEWEPAP